MPRLAPLALAGLLLAACGPTSARQDGSNGGSSGGQVCDGGCLTGGNTSGASGSGGSSGGGLVPCSTTADCAEGVCKNASDGNKYCQVQCVKDSDCGSAALICNERGQCVPKPATTGSSSVVVIAKPRFGSA